MLHVRISWPKAWNIIPGFVRNFGRKEKLNVSRSGNKRSILKVSKESEVNEKSLGCVLFVRHVPFHH